MSLVAGKHSFVLKETCSGRAIKNFNGNIVKSKKWAWSIVICDILLGSSMPSSTFLSADSWRYF